MLYKCGFILFRFKIIFLELPEEVIDENWEIDRCSVEIKDKLGEGAFGLVMKGLMYSLNSKALQLEVAVKMLKGEKFLTFLKLYKLLLWLATRFTNTTVSGLKVFFTFFKVFLSS